MNGAEFKPIVRSIKECSKDDLEAFCRQVNTAGEVAALSPARVRRHGAKLVFVMKEGSLAAVGALKKPDAAYHQSCFAKAGVTDQWMHYLFELGWVYCDKKYRGGMSYRILDALLSEPEGQQPIYATVRADNPAMLRPLGKYNFETIGIPYRSIEHPESEIQLLIRPQVHA